MPQSSLSPTNPNADNMLSQGGKFAARSPKQEQAKKALMAMLPPYEELVKTLNSSSDWWQTWRRKCSGTSGPDQTLPQFASQALATSNIGAIGTVVLAVGICLSQESDDVDKYIETVDRWVLADDELAARLEGIELLILKSKWYADVGQPRKCWLSYRKALMYAQLMVCIFFSFHPRLQLTLYRVFTVSGRRRQLTSLYGGQYTMVIASFLCCWVSHTASAILFAISPYLISGANTCIRWLL